ncbi:MAG: ABC transporter permease [Nitrospirae bacterium]|nr:ABC transporter permease [Nitrospirota bacterium]
MPLKLTDIARKNIRRKIFRSIAISMAVMVVAATLFAITTIMDSVETSLEKSSKRLGADIMVVPAEDESKAKAAFLAGEATTFYMNRDVEDKIRTVKGVRRVAGQLYLKTSQYKCCDVGQMLIIGFEPDKDFTITPWLTTGLKRNITNDEAVMGRELEAFNVGSSVQIYGKFFKIAGMLEPTGMRYIDTSVYIPIDSLREIDKTASKDSQKSLEALKNKISIALVQVEPEISPERVAIFIEYAVPGVKAIVSAQVIATVRKQLFMLLKSILSVSIVLWIMAMLLIAVVFSMIVNERQRELGLLRALGARKREIFKLIITEASTLSLMGGVAGIAAGGTCLFFLKDYIKSTLNIPYLWPSPVSFVVLIAICLALSFITGTGAALYPAIRSMRMEPYAAIRRGE